MASIQCERPVDHTKDNTQYNHVPTNAQNKCNTCGYKKPIDHTTAHHQHVTANAHHQHAPANAHHQHAPANAQHKCNNSCSCCQRKENEHSFTNRMKEMANSAYKRVADQMHLQDQQHNGHRPNTGPKPVNHGSGGVAARKKKESNMSNCIPRIVDHRRQTNCKKKGNECKCKDGSSSSSDSESDNDAHVKRI